MKAVHRRIFIALDEWLGAGLNVYLYTTASPAFWYVFIFWAVAVYAISYPLHWRAEYLDSKARRNNEITDL